MILGIGIDICDIAKLKRAIRARESFLRRVFSENEIRYCSGKKDPLLHYAGRFAVKEAFIKAVSVDKSMRLNEVETQNDKNGKPEIIMNAVIRAALKKKSAKRAMISITHTKTAAAAVCVIS
mgnify:CR=1 FL=1